MEGVDSYSITLNEQFGGTGSGGYIPKMRIIEKFTFKVS